MSRNGRIAPAWQERLERLGLADPAALLDCTPAQLNLAGRHEPLTKPGLARRERWRWSRADQTGESTTIYIKRYRWPDARTQWDRLWRQSFHHSRAWWEFAQAQRLAESHLPTPQAVAVAEDMCGPLERRSAVLLAAAPGDAFDRVWTEAERRGDPITRGLARHDLAVRLGRFVAAFHQSGLCHRDLYLCHIFVDLDPEARRPPTFTLIDLARTMRPRLRRMRWIIKDLAELDSSARQIGATRADRLRFLYAYLGLAPRAPRVRWYVRRICRKSDRILRRIARKSGQP